MEQNIQNEKRERKSYLLDLDPYNHIWSKIFWMNFTHISETLQKNNLEIDYRKVHLKQELIKLKREHYDYYELEKSMLSD